MAKSTASKYKKQAVKALKTVKKGATKAVSLASKYAKKAGHTISKGVSHLHFEQGGELTEDQRIASVILTQLGGMNRLHIMTGAYSFVALKDGVAFKLKNPKANYIKIILDKGKDLYTLEVGRIRGTTYKTLYKQDGIQFDQMKPIIEKETGLYLSLEDGGEIDSEDKYDSGGRLKKFYSEIKEIESSIAKKITKDEIQDFINRTYPTQDELNDAEYVSYIHAIFSTQIERRKLTDEDIEKMMSDSIIKSATKYKTEFGESVLGYESSWNKGVGDYYDLPVIYYVVKEPVTNTCMICYGILDNGKIINETQAWPDIMESESKALLFAKELAGYEHEGDNFEVGGMINHGFYSGDTILEIYKGYGIVQNDNSGVIEVINPNKGTRFIIDWDDSKVSGKKKSLGMSLDVQIQAAHDYINWLDESKIALTDKDKSMEGSSYTTRKFAKGGMVATFDLVPYVYIAGSTDMVTPDYKKIKRLETNATDAIAQGQAMMKADSNFVNVYVIKVSSSKFKSKKIAQILSDKTVLRYDGSGKVIDDVKTMRKGGDVGEAQWDDKFWFDFARLWKTEHISFRDGKWVNTGKYKGAVNNIAGGGFTDEDAAFVLEIANEHHLTLADLKEHNPKFTAFDYYANKFGIPKEEVKKHELKAPAHFGKGKNITVFKYHTKYFDTHEDAAYFFNQIVEENKDKDILTTQLIAQSAAEVDDLFYIEKVVVMSGSATPVQFKTATKQMIIAQQLLTSSGSLEKLDFINTSLIEIARRLPKEFREGGVVSQHLMNIQNDAEKLESLIGEDEKLEAWVISRVSRAASDMSDVTNYLNFELKGGDGSESDGKEEHVVKYMDADDEEGNVHEFVVDAVTPLEASTIAKEALGEDAVIVSAEAVKEDLDEEEDDEEPVVSEEIDEDHPSEREIFLQGLSGEEMGVGGSVAKSKGYINVPYALVSDGKRLDKGVLVYNTEDKKRYPATEFLKTRKIGDYRHYRYSVSFKGYKDNEGGTFFVPTENIYYNDGQFVYDPDGARMAMGGEIKSEVDGLLADMDKTKANIEEISKKEENKLKGEKNALVREFKWGNSWDKVIHGMIDDLKDEISDMKDAIEAKKSIYAHDAYLNAMGLVKDIRKMKFGAGVYATHFENKIKKIYGKIDESMKREEKHLAKGGDVSEEVKEKDPMNGWVKVDDNRYDFLKKEHPSIDIWKKDFKYKRPHINDKNVSVYIVGEDPSPTHYTQRYFAEGWGEFGFITYYPNHFHLKRVIEDVEERYKKDKLIFEEGGTVSERHKYKLGDKYRKDFDIAGMLNLAIKSTPEWGVAKLKKLYNSLEDLNFATVAAPLWAAIQALIAKDYKQVSESMELFHESALSALNDYEDVEGFAKGGGVDGEEYIIFTKEWLSKPNIVDRFKGTHKNAKERLERLQNSEENKAKGKDYEVFLMAKSSEFEQNYAKGGHIKFVAEADKYNTTWGRMGNKDDSEPRGSFDIRENGKYDDFYLFSLNDFDKEFYKHIIAKLKTGEKLYRYQSHATKIGKMFPLIKVNKDKGLIYFMSNSDDDKKPVFETRGIKPLYLSLSENEKYAKGGETDDYSKNMPMVDVIFSNPDYNYSTNLSAMSTEEDARKYFVGKIFDVGVYPKEQMERVIDIKFHPKGTYAKGGETKSSIKKRLIGAKKHTAQAKQSANMTYCVYEYDGGKGYVVSAKFEGYPDAYVDKVFTGYEEAKNDADARADVPKYAKGGDIDGDKFSKVMSEFKAHKLSDRWGNKVSSENQALAIAYSEARAIGKRYADGGTIIDGSNIVLKDDGTWFEINKEEERKFEKSKKWEENLTWQEKHEFNPQYNEGGVLGDKYYKVYWWEDGDFKDEEFTDLELARAKAEELKKKVDTSKIAIRNHFRMEHGGATDGKWVTAKDVSEDRGFYSDLYKSDNGVRPHGMSDEQLADYMNAAYKLEGKMIISIDGEEEVGTPFNENQFLNYIYPELVNKFYDNGIFLDKKFNISDDAWTTQYAPSHMWSKDKESGEVDLYTIVYNDKDENKIGEIIVNLPAREITYDFPNWEVKDEMKYEGGGEMVNEGVKPKYLYGVKKYEITENIGKAKYTVSFYDGVKTHKDGSPFYDIEIFKNKTDLQKFIKKLLNEGYREKRYNEYAAGGSIPNVYEDLTSREVWERWSVGQRKHFLLDHKIDLAETGEPTYRYLGDSSAKSYDNLEQSIKKVLREHVEEGSYEEGGETTSMTPQQFLKEFWGVNTFSPEQMKIVNQFEIKKLSTSNDEKADAFIEQLKKEGFAVKKKSYSDFTSIMGVKRKEGSRYAKGGEIKNQYVGKSAFEVWDSWDTEQRKHFIKDHMEKILHEKDIEAFWQHYKGSFKDLPERAKEEVERHVSEGQYMWGGKTKHSYEGKTPAEVWKMWDYHQKLHFLDDHAYTTHYKYSGGNEDVWNTLGKYELAEQDNYEKLPAEFKAELEKHIEQGSYKKGGLITGQVGEKIETIAHKIDKKLSFEVYKYGDDGYVLATRVVGYPAKFLEKVFKTSASAIKEAGKRAEQLAEGGHIGFEGLEKKVEKNYVGKKVSAKYREKYGKTYSKAEAKEAAENIAGHVKALKNAKAKRTKKSVASKYA